jgi:hypothetical protein
VTADSPGSPSTPQVQPEEKPSIATARIVWLLIQLAAVALAASGVPLSADFPRPPQSLAVHEMLIAQFVGSAMFLPVLFRGGWRAWLGMILTAGPMLMLSAWLARMPMTPVLLLWVEVAGWVTTLALWREVTPRRVDVLAALALLLSAGGLLVWYLQAEFQPSVGSGLLRVFLLAATLRTLPDPAADLSPLLSTAIASAVALVILTAKACFRRANRRRIKAQTTHPTT